MNASPPSLHPAPRRIALAFPIAQAHYHIITRGITDYARAHARWFLTTSAEAANLPITGLSGWKGDGVIAAITSEAEMAAALKLQRAGIPVVTFSGSLSKVKVPRVRVDNPAIGRLAADHLLACGFRRFGFYGLRDVAYSDDRCTAFTLRLRAHGATCASHFSPTISGRRPWQDELGALGIWLSRLQPPVGILGVNDTRARMIIDAAMLRGLRVPRDIGVLGVDNNTVICDFSEPPLTSITCDWHTVGFEAARRLDNLLHRQPISAGDLLIPPLGIEKRASTDVVVVADDRIAAVVDHIKEHIHEVFGVERLVEMAGISRRALESAFLLSVGASPYRYLCKLRVDRAKEYLVSPRAMKIADISARCGFLDVRRFRVVFRRIEGVSPAAFRRKQLLRSRPGALPS